MELQFSGLLPWCNGGLQPFRESKSIGPSHPPKRLCSTKRYTGEGPRCCNPAPFSRCVARSVRPRGETMGSRPSPPCRYYCCRCCMATLPAVTYSLWRAYGSVRQPAVKPTPDSRCASLTSSWRALEAQCRPVLRAKAGGLAIAHVWSMARDAPCPIPLFYRAPLASRWSSDLGAAFPWHDCWGCSTPARDGS
jgi:hypothetical protein